jgi:hypothetical protein
MTQYKDKAQRFESIPAGILNYPILQAADILLYKADAVPVGEDQRQHLELTREIARKFNAAYGETFPEPDAIIDEEVGRILGLDGEAKMSKSLGNTVPILAEPDEIWARVRTAVTDPQRVRRTIRAAPRCATSSRCTFFGDQATLDDVATNAATRSAGASSASASWPTTSRRLRAVPGARGGLPRIRSAGGGAPDPAGRARNGLERDIAGDHDGGPPRWGSTGGAALD